MSDHMQQPVCYQDLKTYIQNYIHHIWPETWDQQNLNKLHSVHPSTCYWAALPVRRHDVRLTRLRIGHTRFTHRHLLLGENAPECPPWFESGGIIGLKEAGWANWRITRPMGRSDVAIRRCSQKWVDSGRFQRHDGNNRPRQPPDLTFQQGSVKPPHTTRVAMNRLTASQTLLWPARSLSNRACLGRRLHLLGNIDDLARQLSKFVKKYRRRPSGCFITLCHVMWQLASKLEVGHQLIELVTL
ncbi:RNase H domain-containing protein [Trichonephila clavipes]|nr:RNase H domain-containing protein [Trichonephila clavipes]